MKVNSQFAYLSPRHVPQSSKEDSQLVPGAAPALKYIVASLMRGEKVDLGVKMVYDKDASHDDIDLSKLDMRHLTIEDIESLEARYTLAPADPELPADPQPVPPPADAGDPQ